MIICVSKKNLNNEKYGGDLFACLPFWNITIKKSALSDFFPT